ncbi:MAG: alpha/beta fold hydrolase [Caldilinea sp. CFX5]|nr:alpha/beta fold hydrolase [Caldilinea sp. CFX5]
MLRINRLFTLVLLVALTLSACQPIQPAAKLLAPEPVGLRPDAPEYAKHGPFWVGYRALVIDEGTDHPLTVGLWYPALNPQGVKEEITYAVTLKITGLAVKSPTVIYGHALRDAAINAAAAPYPLVIFSHGFSTNAAWYSTIVEHFASYGFAVLAPEHTEHFDSAWSELWRASIDRPRDIKQTLDYAERLTAQGGEMAGLIDMQQVAVAGHSYGGYTALALAGAQYDLAAYNARCAALPENDPNTFLCAPLVPKEADMATRAELDPMPEGLWPSFGDPRVTVIVPMASDSYLFDKAGLAKIMIPMMAIGGTADTGTPYDWGVRPAYDYASSARKTLVTLDGAEHTITTPTCENWPWMEETPFGPWFCFDPVWDKDRGLDLIHHFSTAFLLAELKDDAAAAKALAPTNVAFPGIQYATTAFGQ